MSDFPPDRNSPKSLQSDKERPLASRGSKLGAISGVVITMTFFLPWVRACNQDLTGYDIATNRNGRVEDAWVYWLTLIAGLVCITLYQVIKPNSKSNMVKAGFIKLFIATIGFLPLLNIWINIRSRGGAMEVLYGGWLIVAGYLGVFISSILDFVDTAPEQANSVEADTAQEALES